MKRFTLRIPIDDMLEGWPVEAHKHLREKYGPYFIMEAYLCEAPTSQCRRGKAHAVCETKGLQTNDK
jgi:hypothetical protein